MSEQEKFQKNYNDIATSEGREGSYLDVILARQARINLAHNITLGIGGLACVGYLSFHAFKKNRKMIEEKLQTVLHIPLIDSAVQKQDSVKYPVAKPVVPVINLK